MERSAKRLTDILLAVVALAVLAPLLLAIAVAIALESGRPIIFRTRRIGKDFDVFTMYKFRTMIKDAHLHLNELAHLNVADGMVKIPRDPRVTRLGRWLRRLSLDELPQLWNVIRGEMSLVGPRPHDVYEVVVDRAVEQIRFTMRPGITGLWQVRARSDPTLATRIRLDTAYVLTWSYWLDLQLLLATAPALLLGRGDQIDVLSSPSPLTRDTLQPNLQSLQVPMKAGGDMGGQD